MTQRPSARSPRYALGVALVLLGALLTPLQPAAAAGKPTRSLRPEERRIRELEAQRSKVRASKAKAAARVDALKATDEQIQSALDDLSDHVTSTTARLEDARRAAESAEADLAAATAAQAEAEVQLGALRDRIRTQAVEVFVSGGREDSWSIYSAQTATDATNRKTLLEYRATLNLDSLEDFRTIQENLAIARLRAANASERAKRHRGAVSRRLDSLKAAEAEQEKFAAQVDDRIEASLAEADSLAGIDKGLSDQIVSQQGENWDYQGVLAFSKICTHVGCPIALYEQRTHHLLCPCHQSTFDLADSGNVVFGPAARRMPQLPITVDEEGFLVAVSDFQEPVGPSFWERG